MQRLSEPFETSVHRIEAAGASIFYRAAGDPGLPVILLLHGFPSSSHQFRSLMPRLADRYHVIAPDLPGFGFTEVFGAFVYSFGRLAETVGAFCDALGLTRYALYLFDYGAPVGFRLALERPDAISAIVSQNGNAYEEGMSDGWAPTRAYWADPSSANREAMRSMLTLETTRWQYTHGAPDPAMIAPEGYWLDAALLARLGQDTIQLDLIADYASNVALYPRIHAYLRDRQPPLLAVWGANDPFFLPAGAKAFRRDVRDAEVHLLNAGHFALETHAGEIADLTRDFLQRHVR
ncbi:alpha/beta fold hydrolase [Sphingomonas sp. NFR15]|uniref:alpha/beta fold hydrolase n=1 Tax=Sphingomonas sp. NFR15 TaxID=1566282 RepID=UPI00087EE365|nr:alpha/beta hydrolase [Sphingomonas sp. NFR15]SDA16446.1 Pimeloyl-ACP methyl ester carboxylesterase [Sphingomonas sp. NFR15]